MANGQSTNPDIVVCSDARAISLDAAYRFTALNAAAAAAGKPFTVALAGGNTPALLYRLLASEPFRGAIHWSNTHLFFGDERAVPIDSRFSNYRMAKETLIDRIDIPASNVHRIHGEQPDTELAASAFERELASIFPNAQVPRIDLILLGMGSDGHTASLFPNMPSLTENSRWAVRSEPGLDPFVPRITLTLPVLNNAANVLFLVAGADKAEMVSRVLTGPPDPQALPSQSVRPTNGSLTWLLDRAAAARLALNSE